MATLAGIIIARRSDLRELRKSLKTVDTALEKVERRIKALLSRKRKVPEIKDLEDINLLTKTIDGELDKFVSNLAAAGRAWIL